MPTFLEWIKQRTTQVGFSLVFFILLAAFFHLVGDGVAVAILGAGLPLLLPDNSTDAVRAQARAAEAAAVSAAAQHNLTPLSGLVPIVAADIGSAYSATITSSGSVSSGSAGEAVTSSTVGVVVSGGQAKAVSGIVAILLLGAALAVSACTAAVVAAIPAYITDAELALTGLDTALTAYETATGANATTVTTIQGYITTAENLLTVYKTGGSIDETALETAINDAIDLLEGKTVGGKVGIRYSAAVGSPAFQLGISTAERNVAKLHADYASGK